MNNKVYMQAAVVAYDPAFQSKVNHAKGTLGEIPMSELILDREAEKKFKLQIALNPEDPDFSPLVRYIALRSDHNQNQLTTTGLSHAIEAQIWLLIEEFFPLDMKNPSPGLWIWLRRCLSEDTIPRPILENIAAVANDRAFQDKVRQAKETIGEIPSSEAISEQDLFISATGLSNAIEQSWLLIKEFFPLNTFGLPLLGTWAWLLRCLLGDTIPQPKPESLPLLVSYDPENILSLAKLELLKQYCSKHNLDLTEFEQEFQPIEDKICDFLAQEQRIFIEVIPGPNLDQQIEQLKPIITDAHDAGDTNLEAYKIPFNYEDKVENIFVPRQFRGKTLEEIERLYPVTHASREYAKVLEKTTYERIPPKPRGPSTH
jgi:hypothetical protein